MDREIINSIRVSVPNWKDETAFAELTAILEEYRDCVQQVAFFSSSFHPPLPLDTAREHALILRERIERIKAEGFSCGINVLSTIGHHPERMDEALHGNWRHMTDIDGKTCEGSFCPGDERYREEYVKPLYRIFCAANPDFIWVDDDLRYGHLPIGNGCFCDGCIERFNLETGRAYTRESLKAALLSPCATELRKQWLRRQSVKIAELLRLIGNTVRAYDENITLGFMTGERYFEGYDFAGWADALSDGGRYKIMWRPGGGAYTDRPLSELTDKAEQIGRQVARLPAYVTAVQSEIENFPYRLLQKSPRSTALETLLYVAAGCTGAALNILPDAPGGEPLHVMRGHFEALRKTQPFETLLSKTLGRSPTAGIYDGWTPLAQAALDKEFLTGSGGRFAGAWQELFLLGLPRCCDFDNASCFLLTGTLPRAFSEKELLKILSEGIYMDAGALKTLNDMGYGELTGFVCGGLLPEDSVEIYASHPINVGFEGKQRLCPQVFVHGESRTLLPAPGAQTLCFLTDRHGRIKADCSMGVFRNKLGGRVCVSSHYAVCGYLDTLKSTQMKHIFRYLSDDRMPFITESCARLWTVMRNAPTGPAALIFNPNCDELKDVDVLFGGTYHKLLITTEVCGTAEAPAAGEDGKMTRFTLPKLAPFTVTLLRPVSTEKRTYHD